MLWQQKWERRLLQSFNVRVAKTTQKISLAQMALCVMAFHYSPPFVGLILFQIVWQIGCRYVKICTNISTCTWFKHAFTTYIQAIKSMIWSDAEVAFKDHFPRTRYLRLAQSLCGSFLYARLKNGTNLGTPAAGGPIMFAGGMSTGLPLSKSKSFHQVFIKLGEYVGRHNISTKFYNQPNPPMHSWIMALELSKISVYAL